MINKSTQQEDIICVNIYTPNIGANKFIKQILTDLKGEVGSNTVILRDFIISLTSMDRSFRKKVKKEALALTH